MNIMWEFLHKGFNLGISMKYLKMTMLLMLVLCCGCNWYMSPPGEHVDVSWRTTPDKPPIMREDGVLENADQPTFVYQVGSKDVISIFVRNHSEFTVENMRVDTNGYIRMPNTKLRIYCQGKSIEELEGHIAFSLRKYLKTSPYVEVTVTKAQNRTFYVIGDLKLSGKHQMEQDELDLRDALLMVGAQRSTTADLTQVYVITPDRVNPTYVKIDARTMLLGLTKHNIMIRPGDVIYVPRRFTANVSDFVGLLLDHSSNYTSLDSNFQTIQDLLLERDKAFK